MSRTGCCYDNAAAERFKYEWTNHERCDTLEDASPGLFRYIETFYNTRRRHQTLDYMTPGEFEAQYSTAPAPVEAA